MNCVKCGGISRVFNSAKTSKGVYRERMCVSCGKRWYTEEIASNSTGIGLLINQIKEERRAERKAM